MSDNLNILMVSAENDGIEGCKVGGAGDVVRDVPPILAQHNFHVSIVTPSHECLSKNGDCFPVKEIEFYFSGHMHKAQIYEVSGKKRCSGVTHYLIDHERLRGSIYNSDPKGRAFETDSLKYAFFCMAAAEAVSQNLFGALDHLHLHDWHAAPLLILREYYNPYKSLKKIRTVFTIHNLSFQGQRLFQGHHSSLDAWYWNETEFEYQRRPLADPIAGDCVNLMAAGIGLSDAIHVVSPSYADEILKPSIKGEYYGGEGLENHLRSAYQERRLFGILNGCEYSEDRFVPKLDFRDLCELLKSGVLESSLRTKAPSLHHSYMKLNKLCYLTEKPGIILTSVSRLGDQKTYLMKQRGRDDKSGLEGILEGLGKKGIYFLLGTGEPEYEDYLNNLSMRYDNFLFLNFYSDECAAALYANGDLFLMPSSYEPCGISQMLAMRDGQPCVVHAVGGLKDTVKDEINGFAFTGNSTEEKVDNFAQTCLRAIERRLQDPDKWKEISENARNERFLWEDSISEYIRKLYNGRNDSVS